ncbi:hypothetical protein BH09PSE1_BH09PSE1_12180 [soil metagenome]
MSRWISRLGMGVVLVGLAACSSQDAKDAAPVAPQTLWSGYLASLDGADVDETGVRLEIIDDDPANAAAGVRYELTTGCTGGGGVTSDGKATAVEVLRPCLADDVARIGRLNDIAGQGQNADGGPQATLTWTDSTATLTSSEGHAEFAPDSATAATPG